MKSKFLLLATILFSTISQAQVGNFGIGTSVPGSKLTVNGSFAAAYAIYTASASISTNDYYVAYNGARGTLTLPAATTAAPAAGNILGRVYRIKNTGTDTLTVAAAGSELIDNQAGAGVANIVVNPGYYLDLISKGTTSGTTWEAELLAPSGSNMNTNTYSSNPLTIIKSATDPSLGASAYNGYASGGTAPSPYKPYYLTQANVSGTIYVHTSVTQTLDIILPDAATFKGASFNIVNRSAIPGGSPGYISLIYVKTSGNDTILYYDLSGVHYTAVYGLPNTTNGVRLLSTGLNWVYLP